MNDLPAAGWYRDPHGPDQRYWDGQQWTDHTTPAQQRAMTPSYLPAAAVEARVSPYSMIASDKKDVPVQTVLAWVFTALTLGYMLPWAVAATRGKSNSLAIGLLNFFVGWTVIGWIASLVMACMSHQKFAVSG